MEHSGTTLVSDLLRQCGEMESGFECGALIADSPRDFPALMPYAKHMLVGWQISRQQLLQCCDTDSFATFYQRLADESPLVEPHHQLFDKTPRYIAHMQRILAATDVPVIGVYKDPRASVLSDFRRSGAKDFSAWFEKYADAKLPYMRSCYRGYRIGLKSPSRFLAVSLEMLCFDALKSCQEIFRHLGKAFSIDYLLLEKIRYTNTKTHYVAADIVLEYKKVFSEAQIALIEDRFSEFEDWFFRA